MATVMIGGGEGRALLSHPALPPATAAAAAADSSVGWNSFTTLSSISATRALPCSSYRQSPRSSALSAPPHLSSSASISWSSSSAPASYNTNNEDAKVVDWVNRHAPRDPMVEMDPVTVLRGISREGEAAATNELLLPQAPKDEVQVLQRRLVHSTGAPAPPPINMLMMMNGHSSRSVLNLLGGSLPSLASALFMLTVGAAASICLFTSVRRLGARPSLFSSSSTVKRKLVDKSLRISASIRSAMNIGAASLKASNINTPNTHSLQNCGESCNATTNIEQSNPRVASNLPDIQNIVNPIDGSSIVEEISAMTQEASVGSGAICYKIGNTENHGYQFQNEAVMQHAVIQRGLLTQSMPLLFKNRRNTIDESILDSLQREGNDNCHHAQDQVMDTRDHVTVTIGECGDQELSPISGPLSYSNEAFNGVVLNNVEEKEIPQDYSQVSQREQQDFKIAKENLSNCNKNVQDASNSVKSHLSVSGESNNFRVTDQTEEMQHRTVPSSNGLFAMPIEELSEWRSETVGQAYENKQSSGDMSLHSALPGTENLPATLNAVPLPIIDIDAGVSDKVPKLGNVRTLAAIVPALAVGVGSIGVLVGGGSEGLEIVGLAAIASVLCQDILWAQSRELFKHELNSITDRKTLHKFLEKRNVIIKTNDKESELDKKL